jgi:transcriptional regulator with XRE-family HTH domain
MTRSLSEQPLPQLMKEARKTAGLSLRDLSYLAKVSVPQIVAIEKGTAIPRLDTLQKLCAALSLEIIIREQPRQ